MVTSTHGEPGRLDRVDRHPGRSRSSRRAAAASRWSRWPPRAPSTCWPSRPGRCARTWSRSATPASPRSWPSWCRPGTEVVAGPEGLVAAATAADVVVNGVVGFAGLPVTLAALEVGPPARPGQQGVADRRRPDRAAGPGDPRRRDRAGRLRALRRPPVPGLGGATERRRPRCSITASGGPFRGRSRGRARPASPGRTPWPIRPGRWAPRSRSTRRPS